MTEPTGREKMITWWQAYTPDTDDERARTLFFDRYRRLPEEIHRTGGAVLAGPTRRAGSRAQLIGLG